MGNWSNSNWTVTTWASSNTVHVVPYSPPPADPPATALDRLDERIDRVRQRVAA